VTLIDISSNALHREYTNLPEVSVAIALRADFLPVSNIRLHTYPDSKRVPCVIAWMDPPINTPLMGSIIRDSILRYAQQMRSGVGLGS